jgi:hypothetical protein
MYTTLNIFLAMFSGLLIGYILGHQTRRKDDQYIIHFQSYKLQQYVLDIFSLRERVKTDADLIFALDRIDESLRMRIQELEGIIEELPMTQTKGGETPGVTDQT